MTKLGDDRDRRFVLFEMLKIQELKQYPKFADYDRDTFEMVMGEAEKFAENVLWPLNQKGDEEGCHWKDGEVKTPEGFKAAYDQFVEGGWLTPGDDPEDGGQGLPQSLCTACSECFHGSNMAFANYPNLTHGAGRLLKLFGTPEQKEKYLTRMWSGEWAGTMCLTEPGAGSDLGILKTKAKRREDGKFLIEGTKTFITGGQHDLTPNSSIRCWPGSRATRPGPRASPSSSSPATWSTRTGRAERTTMSSAWASSTRWGSRARPPASSRSGRTENAWASCWARSGRAFPSCST